MMAGPGCPGVAVRNRDLDTVVLVIVAVAAVGASGVAAESESFQVDVVRGGAVSRVVGTETGEIAEVTMREDPRPSSQPKSSEPSDHRGSAQRTYYVILNQVSERDPVYDYGFLPVYRRPHHGPRPSVQYRYRLPQPNQGRVRPRGGDLRF
jgi:hypothetical protein